MEVDRDEYESYLLHYGTPRHSGRYPWGSGENPYQRNASFRAYVTELRKEMSDSEIAKGMGMTRPELVAKMNQAKAENRAEDRALALRLYDKGYSKSAIGRRMGINESMVRQLLNDDIQERTSRATATAAIIEESLLKDGGYIDVGPGSESYLGVSRHTLNNAIYQLKEKGYEIQDVKPYQYGTGKRTTVRVISPPGTEWKEVANNFDQIRLINDDNKKETDRSVLGVARPVAIDPKRVKIRYADEVGADGAKGIEKDGVIELRRGVDDISLGAANYAQVRINVGDSHYLKGMAIYSDDMPKGVDIIFNTNKHAGTPMMGSKDDTVLKPLKKTKDGDIDWDNPFGATIKTEDQLQMAQRYYTDKKGSKQLSALNIVNEEGAWERWSKTLSSQFLSKQTPAMAKKQLKIVADAKKAEFDEIMSLTNPTVKKKLLQEFADECDSQSVHLKAAALPRQSSYIILPVPGLKENEIYAPNYRNGEEVALVRYPHAGRFEIPTLKVNNNAKSARKTMGNNPLDAVGINAKVAAQLSGADFDGDTVTVIPTKGTDIKAYKPWKELIEFDPKETYRAHSGMPETSSKTGFLKQQQMGSVSNLITDMTIRDAPREDIVKAVKHSMTVIDAEKHNLDWRRSERENNIPELKARYQGGSRSGASTLISKAHATKRIDEVKEISPDKRTGERRYIPTGKTYVNKKGETVKRQTKTTYLGDEKDARNLSSGTVMENIYADHSNRLKSMANEARKASISMDSIPYSPSARKTYAREVAELNARLEDANRNKPKERQATLISNAVVRAKVEANPELKLDENRDELKKIRYQALREARERTGAKKDDINITDAQWEAIQAGAISKTKLEKILDNADSDRVRELATPRINKTVSPSVISRIKSMQANGATQSEIADALGLSTSTVNSVLKT